MASPSFASPVPPPPRRPLVKRKSSLSRLPVREPPTETWAAFSHEGGAGGVGKENQDTWLTMQLDNGLSVFAVLDGHGKMFGQLAALAARDALREYLRTPPEPLPDDVAGTERMLRDVFRHMHASICDAMQRADSSLRLHTPAEEFDGCESFLLKWMAVDDDDEEEPHYKWDAVDGGTTATVVVVKREEWVVVAAVGDSSCVLI